MGFFCLTPVKSIFNVGISNGILLLDTCEIDFLNVGISDGILLLEFTEFFPKTPVKITMSAILTVGMKMVVKSA